MELTVINGIEILYEKPDYLEGAEIISMKNQDEEKTISAFEVPAMLEGIPVKKLGKKCAIKLRVGTLTLPETDYPLLLREACFKECKHIEKIIISGTVNTIPEECFKLCSAKEIIFKNADKVKKVGTSAFSFIFNIKSFKWFPNCEEIPENCFSGSSIEEINGHENVKRMLNYAFHQSKIKNFRWPNDCRCIPEGCFSFSELHYIHNMRCVRNIERSAFLECPNLTSFRWPMRCNTIPRGCFCGSGIEKVTNIERVVRIEESAFQNTKKLKRFIWPANCKEIPNFCFRDGGLTEIKFSKETSLVCIGGYAFSGVHIKELIVPSFQKEDIDTAFENMPHLEKVILPDMDFFPSTAFRGCKSLKEVIFTTRELKISELDMETILYKREDIKNVHFDASQVLDLCFENDCYIDSFFERISLGFNTEVSFCTYLGVPF